MPKPYQYEPPRCGKTMPVAAVLSTDWRKQNAVAEVKEDGRRYLLQIRPNGSKQNYLTSRRISVVTGAYVEKQDSVPFIRDAKFPVEWHGWVLDGEIIAKGAGKTSNEAATAMAGADCDFVVWDIFHPERPDTLGAPLHKRRLILNRFLDTCQPDWLRMVEHSNDPAKLLRLVTKKGGEGIIIKHAESAYGAGWIKVKHEHTEDCVIIGYQMATEGKYFAKGWIKNVLIGQYVKELPKGVKAIGSHGKLKLIAVGAASGFNDAMRARLTARKAEYIGTVVEVKANLRLPSGKFRHPRVIKFRDDKNPEHCIYTPAND